MRRLSPRKLIAAAFAVLAVCLGLAAASAQAHPGFHGWSWYGNGTGAVHDDCFSQRRLFIDRDGHLQVRDVNICD